MANKDREAVFQPEFIEDLKYWVKNDRKTALRVIKLIEDILRDPFDGIGKPESLKYLAPVTNDKWQMTSDGYRMPDTRCRMPGRGQDIGHNVLNLRPQMPPPVWAEGNRINH